MGQNTPEYRTMIICTSKLETVVKDNLTVIVGELQAASIISPKNASALRNSAIDTAERAANLVAVVTNKVELSASYYHLFVSVLMSEREANRIILQVLEQTYRDLGGSGGEKDASGMQHVNQLPVSACHLETIALTESKPLMSVASPPSPDTDSEKNRSMSTPGQLSFCDSLSKDDFEKWLCNKGLEKKEDHCVLHDVGVNAKCLARLDKASAEEIAGKLSLGGRIIFMDVCKEVKENGLPVTSTSTATEHNTSNGSTDGAGSNSHLDQPLEMKDHFDISQRLKVIPNEALVSLGGALGLYHPKLMRMKVLPDEMVAAWLRKEDKVLEHGRPTWRVLANALRAIGQTGVADNIENT